LFEIERKRNPLIPTVAQIAPIDEWWMASQIDIKEVRLLRPWIPKLIASIFLLVILCLVSCVFEYSKRNPIIVAIVGGVLFSLTGWTLPSYLENFCT
jgi:hypothetical protein